VPRRALIYLSLLCAGLAGSPVSADDEPRTVRDLAYGEVLFYFYQDEHFAALTRLLAAVERDELPSHARDAELLLGGLYLSYGQHLLAGDIFERVLADSVDPLVHDRAWFFLAKVWRQRGYLNEAEAALGKIAGELPEPLQAERQMLHAQVLMDLGRFEEALARLAAWEKPDREWVGYAKFNIGVALIRLGRVAEGAEVLAEVGALDPENPRLAPLRDKANSALGYALLQADRPVDAKPSLQRVRLDGPYSNKALLGVGWADAALLDYRAALAPWIELRGRDLLDSAVQESMLAVPYAFAQLGALKQAADYYVDGIAAFDKELARLDASIESIRSGEFIEEVLDRQTTTGSGWYWRLDRIPESPTSRYLYELMASHRFQEGLKTYRDILYLDDNLDEWTDSLVVFDDILDTRHRAYLERLPRIDASLARMDLEQMGAQRSGLEARLTEIERRDDFVAMGTAEQQHLWHELAAMEPLIPLVAGQPRGAEIADKQRFLKGLLLWDLHRDYPARLWAEQRNLRAAGTQIKEAQRAYEQVDAVRESWPEDFAALTGRIAALQPRVAGLRDATRASLDRQRAYLQGMALDELQARRQRVTTYLLQARFALASVYDRAAADYTPAADSTVAEERP
jgi:hypothetical protein